MLSSGASSGMTHGRHDVFRNRGHRADSEGAITGKRRLAEKTGLRSAIIGGPQGIYEKCLVKTAQKIGPVMQDNPRTALLWQPNGPGIPGKNTGQKGLCDATHCKRSAGVFYLRNLYVLPTNRAALQ